MEGLCYRTLCSLVEQTALFGRGISGIASDNVSFFGGGTYQNALLDAGKEFKSPMSVGALDKKDGSGHRAFGKFAWDKHGQLYAKGTIEATTGKIGDYEIVGGNITGRTEEAQ